MRFKEIIQVSEDARTLLRLLDDKYKWIARDAGGGIYAYSEKPHKGNFMNKWYTDSNIFINLNTFKTDFNFLSWEDDEPTRISDLL